jgi:nitronate monooxygenase/enoyl-[acyl-carrier protein] reductase II
MALVPQVVDAVSPLPVVAAGGIFDGRGLAAALVLGAVGVNLGTRFLACTESPITDAYKQVIVGASSEDAIKVDVLNEIIPFGNLGYGTVLRAIRSPFIDEWQGKRADARREAERLRQVIMQAGPAGTTHDVLPTAGQTAGAIHDVLPAAQIIERIISEAEAALRSPAALFV